MKETGLPPLIGNITNGSVTWKRIESIDYEILGYFLSCHLIIEHYLDEFLKISYPNLNWDAARQTFGQKVELLSAFRVSEKYDCIPAIKHLNSLRNKLSHNIEFKIEMQSLLPLSHYLQKACGGKQAIPTEPKALLDMFTTMTCVLFAGYISGQARNTNLTRK